MGRAFWPVKKTGEVEKFVSPLPLFVRIVRFLLLSFAEIKSTMPSPFTSIAATHAGVFPTPGPEESTKLPKFVLKLSAPKQSTLRKSTLISPAPLLEKFPLRFTLLEPLVPTTGGNYASGSTPEICVAVTLPTVAANIAYGEAVICYLGNSTVIALPPLICTPSSSQRAAPGN